MERFQHLIDKLAEQKGKGEDAARLLITVQELHRELALLVQSPQVAGSSKVAVLMPPSRVSAVPEVAEQVQPKPAPIPEADRRFIPSDPTPAPLIAEQKTEVAEPKIEERPVEKVAEKPAQPYALQKPFFDNWDSPEETDTPKEVFSLSFDEGEEIAAPTLPQESARGREIHEVITEKKESLNDRLKQEQLELGASLKEAPIKDLRKGIGVNDKFLFISELFRGDEDMYERSIKTINGFRILPEAEYWINRELKVKLGWNDTKDTVQHFYGVVRRRFAAM
ncbi:MAG TPA: hypothetical protein VGB56_07275 [Flavisolibacter sp.]